MNNSFSYDKPFQLTLEDGSVLHANKVVRVLPGRRLVAFGVWQNQQVVAKLFFDPKQALRHSKKDADGVKLLLERKIPTPVLLYQGLAADLPIQVLLFNRILDADSLEQTWQNKKNVEGILPSLEMVVVELATQHVTGTVQHDLHFKNFLLTEKIIYTIDGGQVEGFPHLLSKKVSMENLALFFSQMGVGMEKYQEHLFKYYAKARGWRLKSQDMTDMFLLIREWNDERWRKFEKKIGRNSTQFCQVKTWRTHCVYDRSYSGKDFKRFLADPDYAFQHPTAQLLKNGRSSTVVKVMLDDKTLVIKRYNLKNLWHRLRRCMRSTRAFHSWRLAHKMKLFGIPTATPVAYLEDSIAGLKGKSYYVMEYVPGEHAGDFFVGIQDSQTTQDVIQRIINLLRNLRKLEVTHGDLKMTNILIDNQYQPVLIDLDGAAEHRSVSGLNDAWQQEIKRFLENFRDIQVVRKKFEEGIHF